MGRKAKWIKKMEELNGKSEARITRTNPFSGESAELTQAAAAIYDTIKGAEIMGEYTVVRQGLDWFITNHAKEYMTLLD
jgi:hypothetical protein